MEKPNPSEEHSVVASASGGVDDQLVKQMEMLIKQQQELMEMNHHLMHVVQSQQKQIESLIELSVSNAKKEHDNSSQLVGLNIGGKIFQTTKNLLCSGGGNYFTGLLSGGFSVDRDAQNNIFIDRDPTHFQFLLNFLRHGGEVVHQLKDYKENDINLIVKEAEFYGLTPLINQIYKFQAKHVQFDPSTLIEGSLRFWNHEIYGEAKNNYYFCCCDYSISKKKAEMCDDKYLFMFTVLVRYGRCADLRIGLACKNANKFCSVQLSAEKFDKISAWYSTEHNRIFIYLNSVFKESKEFILEDKEEWNFYVQFFTSNQCGIKIIQQEQLSE